MKQESVIIVQGETMMLEMNNLQEQTLMELMSYQ